MQKLIGAAFLLVVIVALNSKAFAAPLNCSFKAGTLPLQGIKSLQIEESEDVLKVNQSESIALRHTRIKCGTFGRQHRFDGVGGDKQIILKSCTDEAVLEGHLIDTKTQQVADIVCL